MRLLIFGEDEDDLGKLQVLGKKGLTKDIDEAIEFASIDEAIKAVKK